jgi:hypothetical protein
MEQNQRCQAARKRCRASARISNRTTKNMVEITPSQMDDMMGNPKI